MSTDAVFTVMKLARKRTLDTIGSLTDEQLLEVPAPFRNNILWNLGHVLYVQYALSFGPASIALPVPAEFKDLYMRNSSPAEWAATPSIEDVKSHLTTSVETIEEALRGGKLTNYKPHELASGLTLSSAEHAFNMLNFHEGVHLGTIMSIKKFLG